ncbi:S8 family serine peptidase [Aquimarina sp. W85]|uniref:S8 family serine peptidase n=1 Tax=Aquimarina rhodophyticola TaxID=3342246 RepID=UPI00366E5B04
MNYKRSILFLLTATVIMSCAPVSKELPVYTTHISKILSKKESLAPQDQHIWQHKDYLRDTIPGVSTEKALELLRDKKANTVIIALLDTEVDIQHPTLRDQIWINQGEIPDNGIDDDTNGYIDDIHGWNFLGNTAGENTFYTNYEYTRILKKYASKFQNKKIEDIADTDVQDFSTYQKAKQTYDAELKEITENTVQYNAIYASYKNAQTLIGNYINADSITLERLDSLKIARPDLDQQITLLSNSIRYEVKEQDMLDQLEFLANSTNKYLNLSFDDRGIIGDNPEDLTDTFYGNSKVSNNVASLYHGTLVAGVLAAKMHANKFRGFSKKFKLMPLAISSNGDEHDKDIALAIRYAVDNGAKIINMSSGKNFSMHTTWVNDAIAYANKNEVLIVTSAGNDNQNIDLADHIYYPNDHQLPETNNFIKVGAISQRLDSAHFKFVNSSYGKLNVDLFAPGEDIYTTAVTKDLYDVVSGTSFATPMVAGVAGLLFSYFPELTVAEVKEILLNSGTSYEIEIAINDETKGTPKMIPFAELSKSGKVVNAFNAVRMAQQIAEK